MRKPVSIKGDATTDESARLPHLPAGFNDKFTQLVETVKDNKAYHKDKKSLFSLAGLLSEYDIVVKIRIREVSWKITTNQKILEPW